MTIKSSVSTRSNLSFSARKSIRNQKIHSSVVQNIKLKKQFKNKVQKPSSIALRIKNRKSDTFSCSSNTTTQTKDSISNSKRQKSIVIGVQTLKKVISKKNSVIIIKKSRNDPPKRILANRRNPIKSVSPVLNRKIDLQANYTVDIHCPIDFKVKVYSEKGYVYDKMLNQSNIGANNNKFYVIQTLVEKSNSNNFWIWNRWGRVGVAGQNALHGPMDKAQALREFRNKLFSKTKKGNYVEIKIDHGVNNTKIISGLKKHNLKSNKVMSKEVRELINLIFDENMLNSQLKLSGYDCKKMPLGKLSQQAINDGYKILSKLLKGLNEGKDIQFCENLSSQFYTLIPHDFGFKKMINFILDTEDKIKEKLKMLQSLSEMQVATQANEQNLLSEDKTQANYDMLDCNLEYISKNEEEYKIVSKFFENTKGYHNMKITDVFKIEKKKTFASNLNNRMLLWHGSGIGNYVGILSQGLRIAPPEAPASGYLLGKGLYFADLLEKSANYIGTNEKNEGLVLLVDVALGNMNHLFQHNSSAANLPSGKNSVKCCGSKEPPKSSYIELEKTNVPLGKPINTKLKSCVNHNEYVVYNTDQANFRYLIKVKY